MGDEYKMNLQLGDEAICAATLRRFKNKLINATHEQVHKYFLCLSKIINLLLFFCV